MTSLSSKVVVITGSSRGIGLAIAEACARAGAGVVISSRKRESLEQGLAGLRRCGINASGLPADVSIPADLKQLFEFALKQNNRIDVWINNAGISGGYRTLQSMSPVEIKEVLDINLLGTLFACRLLIPYFRERSGIILNVSGRGNKGNPAPYQAPYAATKAGVSSLTRSLAAENKAYPLSINCIMPGMVKTDMYREIATCPETEGQMAIMPVLLKAWASPIADVQELAVKLCAQKPGEHTGKCYSAEKWTRYLRAAAASPEFMRAIRGIRGKK
jgi:NAD(P)-dependent dehydrogenase (short-subunit alcohol dehydrogenase family)